MTTNQPGATMPCLQVPYSGHLLLQHPLYNKGTAFTREERRALGIQGLLPPHEESMEEQLQRVYTAYSRNLEDLSRHVYLRGLQDRNEVLFYALLTRHVSELMPIVYTPTVGAACQQFSSIYRRPRGLFVSYPYREQIDEILSEAMNSKVKVIVVTDGERILGLGDQGVDGMGIPIGKLSLYTACGGVDPASTLPIVLDAGTNNAARRNDPLYLGWRHERITGEDYYAFVNLFVEAVKKRFPEVLLQFEDFARPHAEPLLQKYRDQLCSFNDDIQGTATVTLGAALAAVRALGSKLSEQRVAMLGAGSAGCGIAEQLVAAMRQEGLSDQEARGRFFMVDRYGLLIEGADMTPAQQKLARRKADLQGWDVESGEIRLEAVVRNAHPSLLIGVSGQPSTFTQAIVREMAKHCPRPIILPLSNPTSQSEAVPADLLRWTEGKALVCTGTAFPPVQLDGVTHLISQCNNCYIFPGVGQGVLSSGARRVSDAMFLEASRALAAASPPALQPGAPLLPLMDNIQEANRAVAVAVARQAQKEGLATIQGDPETLVAQNWWHPVYLPMVPR